MQGVLQSFDTSEPVSAATSSVGKKTLRMLSGICQKTLPRCSAVLACKVKGSAVSGHAKSSNVEKESPTMSLALLSPGMAKKWMVIQDVAMTVFANGSSRKLL